MIEITAKIMGKSAQIVTISDGDTVGDVQNELGLEGNYTYNVGGKPASTDTELTEGAYVVFAPAVKGA